MFFHAIYGTNVLIKEVFVFLIKFFFVQERDKNIYVWNATRYQWNSSWTKLLANHSDSLIILKSFDKNQALCSNDYNSYPIRYVEIWCTFLDLFKKCKLAFRVVCATYFIILFAFFLQFTVYSLYIFTTHYSWLLWQRRSLH